MILLLDAGNSRLKWAVLRNGHYEYGGVLEHGVVAIKELASAAWSLLDPPEAVLVANVAGEALRRALNSWIKRHWKLTPEYLAAPREEFGIHNAYREAARLGIDRWLALLAARGYRVAAVTGRMDEAGYLTGLGAATVLDRAELTGTPRPLGKERWAGAIDVAGGVVLANVLSMMAYRGVVAACGLAGGRDLPTTVTPFILRGVTLAGVDSVMCPLADRLVAWQRLAAELDMSKLDAMVAEVPLAEVSAVAPRFLEGQVRGRIVVPVNPALG